MDAGTGADEQARRLARRVDKLREELSRAERQQRAWEAGAAGERRVGQVLGLLPDDWQVLHDLHWPGRPKANIDHIAIGPRGLFLLDTKNWSGEVWVRDGVLRQNGYARSRETAAVSDAAAAVTELLAPRERNSVHGVLVLANSQLPPTSTREGVLVCGDAHLVEFLTSFSSPVANGSTQILAAAEIDALRSNVERQLGVPTAQQLTSAALERLPVPQAHELAARVRHRPPAARPHSRATRKQPSRQAHPRGTSLTRMAQRLAALAVAAVLALALLPTLAEAVGQAFAERLVSSTIVHPPAGTATHAVTNHASSTSANSRPTTPRPQPPARPR